MCTGLQRSSVTDKGALVDLAAVKKGLADGTTQFVDARTPAEYSGVNPNGNARAGTYCMAAHLLGGRSSITIVLILSGTLNGIVLTTRYSHSSMLYRTRAWRSEL